MHSGFAPRDCAQTGDAHDDTRVKHTASRRVAKGDRHRGGNVSGCAKLEGATEPVPFFREPSLTALLYLVAGPLPGGRGRSRLSHFRPMP